MTREEAIANLNMISVAFVEPVTEEQRKLIDDTFDMAIKALEQEPCIQEKQANADKIDAVYIDGFKAGYSQAIFDLEQEPCEGCDYKEWLKGEIEPKTGHWIEEFNDLEGEVRFTCSSCGKFQLFGTDFCYHCGARMIESEGRTKDETDN